MKRDPCICGAKATLFRHEDGRYCVTCTTGTCWSGPMSWDARIATEVWNVAMRAMQADKTEPPRPATSAAHKG
jgi:hypothetical protein